MELIKDLGTRAKSVRWGLYKCPECSNTFERASATVEYSQRNGGGKICRNCSNKIKAQSSAPARTKTLAKFIEEALVLHEGKYSYANAMYGKNNKDKLSITCSKHGDFLQAPGKHLSGDGCPACALDRSNIAQRMSERNTTPTKLYYVYFPEPNLWKLGCTSRTLEERFRQEKLVYEVLYVKEYPTGTEAYTIEKYLLDATKEFQFKGRVLDVKGNTELRTKPIDNLALLLRMAEATYNILN